MTPQVQAELAKNPGQIQLIGDSQVCTSALKAMKTLGYSGPIILISQCITPGALPGTPGGYAGMKEVTVTSGDPSDPDVKLFNAVMATYAPSTKIVDVTNGTFASMLGFVRAMSGLTGDVTPATVEAAFASASPQLLPLGNGSMFQCNGKQISFAPAICATGALAATLDEAGNSKGGFQTLDVSALMKLS
jgi:branched-chain amino acid transport system substrate-binding protein